MAGVMVHNKFNVIQAWESYYWSAMGHCLIAETDLDRCMKLPFFDHNFHKAQMEAKGQEPQAVAVEEPGVEPEAAPAEEPETDGETPAEAGEGPEAVEEPADADAEAVPEEPTEAETPEAPGVPTEDEMKAILDGEAGEVVSRLDMVVSEAPDGAILVETLTKLLELEEAGEARPDVTGFLKTLLS